MSSRPQPFVARQSPPPFQFGSYLLDLQRGALFRGDEEIKLRPKSHETLKYLVLNGGRLIPKAELISALWPDAISVSDDSLMQCIRDARRALGESGHEFIRTVPGRGYMFDAPVQTPAALPSTPRAQPPAPSRRHQPLLVWMAVAFAWKRVHDRNQALAAVARVKQLAAAGNDAEAYPLALSVLRQIPAEATVLALLPDLRDDFSSVRVFGVSA